MHTAHSLTPRCSRAVEKSMKNCTAVEGTGEEEEEEEKRMRPLFTLRDGLTPLVVRPRPGYPHDILTLCGI